MKIDQRLEALEKRPPKADPEKDARFSLALKGMLDTLSMQTPYAAQKVAPFHIVGWPSDLEKLWDRIQSKTLTEADRTLMDSWPKCHVPPEVLVDAIYGFKTNRDRR